MSCYSHGVRMSDWYKPEIYEDKYLFDLIDKIYDDCMHSDCEKCPHHDELDNGDCMSDIIMELWRRLSNAQHRLEEKDEKSN